MLFEVQVPHPEQPVALREVADVAVEPRRLPRDREVGVHDAIDLRAPEAPDRLVHRHPEVREDDPEPDLHQPLDLRRLGRLHRIAGVGERARRLVEGGSHRRMGFALGDRDPDRTRERGAFQRGGHPEGIAGVGLGHRGEPETHVAHLAGDRPLHRHHLHEQRPLLRLGGVVGGHPAEGRPDGGASAAVRGDPERAADVVAVSDRPHSRRHARRRPARRSAAGHPFGVPRVAGEPAQRIIGERAEREFRGIGPTDDHRARPCEVARDRGIFGGR